MLDPGKLEPEIHWKKAEDIAASVPSTLSLHCKVPESQKLFLEKIKEIFIKTPENVLNS